MAQSTDLAQFIIAINSVIDVKAFSDLDPSEVTKHVLDHDVLSFLKHRLVPMPPLMDTLIASFEGRSGIVDDFERTLGGCAAAYHNAGRSRYGVEHNGLCLLIAYAAEAISSNA